MNYVHFSRQIIIFAQWQTKLPTGMRFLGHFSSCSWFSFLFSMYFELLSPSQHFLPLNFSHSFQSVVHYANFLLFFCTLKIVWLQGKTATKMPARRSQDGGWFLCFFFFVPSPRKGVEQNYKKLRAIAWNVLNMRICYVPSANIKWKPAEKLWNKRILIRFFFTQFNYANVCHVSCLSIINKTIIALH